MAQGMTRAGDMAQVTLTFPPKQLASMRSFANQAEGLDERGGAAARRARPQEGVSLSDEDRRILAAVAMGIIDVVPYGIRGRRWQLYFIQGRDITKDVRRLMTKQLVAYRNGKLQSTNR